MTSLNRWHTLAVLVVLIGLAPGAEAATALRCTVDLTEADGTVTTVPGWGADRATATGQARRWARILASERFAERMWAWAFWGDPLDEEIARGEVGLATADDPLQTPGATVADGKCKKVRRPGKGIARWQASWSSGSPATVVREDPSTAIEAARRRACVAAADTTRRDYFRSVAYLAGDQKAAEWRAGSSAAVADLFACVAGGEPELAPTEGAAELPRDHGAYQCQAVASTDAGLAVGVGWSTDIERAGEEALTELVYTRRRTALGAGLLGSATAAVEMKQTLLALHYASSMPAVATSDLADRSRLGCTGLDGVELPALSWVPGSVYALEDCGERVGWPGVTGLSSPAAAGDARDALCRERAYYGVTLANEALAAASPEVWSTMARAGWGTALSCEADCLGNTALATEPRILALPGIPDRSSPEAAEARLFEAIVLRDLDLLTAVAPMFDDPSFRESLLPRYPLVFWLSLPSMIGHGLDEGELAWRQVGGQWLLLLGS